MMKVISEIDTRIEGFSCGNYGLYLFTQPLPQASDDMPFERISFPFNRNRPLRLNPYEYNLKKIHITIEIEEDEEDNVQ